MHPYAGDTTSHTAELLHPKSIIMIFHMISKWKIHYHGECV